MAEACYKYSTINWNILWKKKFSYKPFFIPTVLKILLLSIVVVSCAVTFNTSHLLKYRQIWYPHIRLKWPSFPSSPSPHENTFPSTVNAIACRPPEIANIHLHFWAFKQAAGLSNNLTLLLFYNATVWAFQFHRHYLFSLELLCDLL